MKGAALFVGISEFQSKDVLKQDLPELPAVITDVNNFTDAFEKLGFNCRSLQDDVKKAIFEDTFEKVIKDVIDNKMEYLALSISSHGAESPPDDKKNAESPPDVEKNAESPPDDEKNTESPPDDEKNAKSPPDVEKNAESPPNVEKNAESPPAVETKRVMHFIWFNDGKLTTQSILDHLKKEELKDVTKLVMISACRSRPDSKSQVDNIDQGVEIELVDRQEDEYTAVSQSGATPANTDLVLPDLPQNTVLWYASPSGGFPQNLMTSQ